MEEFSFEKASKFSNKDKFFDINFLWLPGFENSVRKLYYTNIRPETIVILSLIAGLIAAYLYSLGSYYLSLAAILFIQLKNYLDSIDGHIARAKNLQSRFGRFLDSLSDALVYFCLFTGIAVNFASDMPFLFDCLLSCAAMFSAFLQCSVYNYYVVSYKTYLLGKGINRTDESFTDEEKDQYKKGLSGIALYVLQLIYQGVYAWQDKVVAHADSLAREKSGIASHTSPCQERDRLWYADKKFLSLVSPLCFGTQILALSIFTLADNLIGFLWFIIIVGNIYTVLILLWKTYTTKIPSSEPSPSRMKDRTSST